MNILWDELALRLIQVYIAVSSQVHNTGLGSLPVGILHFSQVLYYTGQPQDWIAPGFMQ